MVSPPSSTLNRYNKKEANCKIECDGATIKCQWFKKEATSISTERWNHGLKKGEIIYLFQTIWCDATNILQWHKSGKSGINCVFKILGWQTHMEENELSRHSFNHSSPSIMSSQILKSKDYNFLMVKMLKDCAAMEK